MKILSKVIPEKCVYIQWIKKKTLDNNLNVNIRIIMLKTCCDWEIESLFSQSTRSVTLNGKKLSLAKDFDSSTHFGKAVFATYISQNYLTIDFSMFKSLFNAIEQAHQEYCDWLSKQ